MSITIILLVFATCATLVTGYDNQGFADGLHFFSGLDVVLDYFRNSSDPLAHQILFTFETECFYMAEPEVPRPDDPTRKAFIVIEGNHRPSRDSVGMKLARMVDGRYLNNPAPCLIRYLPQLPAGSMLRRAYYVLSLYATDFNVRVQLSTGRTAVLNGCWLDQLTFSLLKTYGDEELPDLTSPVFSWPRDLMQPDITFYLTLPNSFHSRGGSVHRRPVNSWQNRSLELYRALQDVYPIVIQDHKVRVDTVYQEIVRRLANKREVRLQEEDEDSRDVMYIFTGLEGVLAYFRNNTSPLAQRILETFENECYPRTDLSIPTDSSRKPFIVIEGNGHTSRDIVGKALARKMNARYMLHPASCLVKFLDILPKRTLLRRAYYVLSLYAMSFNVRAHLSTNRAVILNGYWLDQLTFSLVQSYPEDQLPPHTSEVFRMPEELFPPDLIVYLHLDDNLRSIQPNTTNAALSWYTRALNLYVALQARYPIVVERLKGDDRSTANVVFQHVHDRLSATRDIFVQDYEEVSQVISLFAGLQEVLDYFKTSTNPIAKDILKTFQRQCFVKSDPMPRPRKPFIVVEGNNRTSRDVVITRMARIMDGVSLRHPASCLRGFSDILPKGSLLRRAFYILSLYAISMDVNKHLAENTVILNGYWLDQLTFALIQSFPFGRLPQVSSPIFKWPRNLLQPDIVVYLNHPDELHHRSPLSRSHKNWKPRALDLYQKLQSVYNILMQDLQPDYWQTTDEIYQYIVQNLDLS